MEAVHRSLIPVNPWIEYSEIVSLIILYLLSFLHLPLDNIENRSYYDIVASVYGIFYSIINCGLIAFFTEDLPKKSNFGYFLILIAEVVGCILFWISFFCIINCPDPLSFETVKSVKNAYERHDTSVVGEVVTSLQDIKILSSETTRIKVDCTSYFQVISLFTALWSCVPVILLVNHMRLLKTVYFKNMFRYLQMIKVGPIKQRVPNDNGVSSMSEDTGTSAGATARYELVDLEFDEYSDKKSINRSFV